MVCAQRIDGYQNDGIRPGCQRETPEGPERTSEQPPHEPRCSQHQNWNRKAKLMTRELEDPLR